LSEAKHSIFANRSFLDYFGMYLTSRSAFQIASVGLIWIVYMLTHSALDVAIVGIANTLSTVFVTLPAGVWIDRTNRHMLLLISNVVSVSCLALLTLLTVIRTFTLFLVVPLVVVWAAAGELYRSTSYAVIPDIVKQDELSGANGVTQSSFQIINAISTVLGGALIVAAGVVFTFIYGVVGYALAAIFSAFLFFRFHTQSHETPSSRAGRNMGREILEGFRWLITQRGLFGLSLLALVFNFAFGIPVYFLVIYVTDTLKTGALIYGALLAIFAAGGGAGSLIAGRMSGAIAHAGKLVILLWGVLGGGLLFLIGLIPMTTIALIAVLGIGLGTGFGNNVWLTSAQNLVPAEMRGRYFAIDGLLSFVGGPPAIAVGGILITLIGITQVFELSGLILLVSAFFFAFMKTLWVLDGRIRTTQV
jgi:MFS family permease